MNCASRAVFFAFFVFDISSIVNFVDGHEETNNGTWNQVVSGLARKSGHILERDYFLESLVGQLFRDYVRTSMQSAGSVHTLNLGSSLDPIRLYPVEEKVQQSPYTADLRACNVWLHNLKTARLLDVQVQRRVDSEHSDHNDHDDLDVLAIRLVLRAPILWMSGSYALERSRLFGFIPVNKDRRGSFNIDMEDVVITVMAVFDSSSSFTSSLYPSKAETKVAFFKVELQWKGLAFKFERIAGRFSTVADMALNQLGLGELIVRSEKSSLVSELQDYIHAIFQCGLSHPARGVEECMVQWWQRQGWQYPWAFPKCAS